MKDTDKIDLFRQFRREYAATRKPALVDVGPARYLAIAGRGAPGGEAFTAGIGGLYALAFTIKMSRKFAGEGDYVIGKLECQWWGETGEDRLDLLPMEQWRWRLMIRTPDFIDGEHRQRALEQLERRGKAGEAEKVSLEDVAEGKCVQILHVGPYQQETESIGRMAEFAAGHGYRFHGRHHEIYLSDPRRVPPERLKTILRRPVVPC